MTNWEPLSKLILLQLHKKLPKNSTLTILWSFGICSKWERVKMLYKWVPHELTENREIVILFYATTMNHFSIKLWCVMKSGFYVKPAMTRSVVGPRRSSKVLPKAKLAPKRGHGQFLVFCYPLQLSESWWNHYIWEVRSANWWYALKTVMPATRTGQENGPNSSPWQCLIAHCTTNTSKVEQTGLQTFASFAIFTWHLVNRLPCLQASWQLFVGKMLPPPGGGRKCFPRVRSAPEPRIFMLQE